MASKCHFPWHFERDSVPTRFNLRHRRHRPPCWSPNDRAAPGSRIFRGLWKMVLCFITGYIWFLRPSFFADQVKSWRDTFIFRNVNSNTFLAEFPDFGCFKSLSPSKSYILIHFWFTFKQGLSLYHPNPIDPNLPPTHRHRRNNVARTFGPDLWSALKQASGPWSGPKSTDANFIQVIDQFWGKSMVKWVPHN